MSTKFYDNFNVQSNSKKNSTQNFKKSLCWKFQEMFYFYFNANLYLLCCENSMSKVVPRKILSPLQVQNLCPTFNCKLCCENSMSKVVPKKILSLLQVQNLCPTFNCKVPT
jgi:hypothetical protein